MNIILFGEDIFSATVLQSLIDAGINVQLVICPLYENDNNYRNIQKVTDAHHIEFIREKNVNSENIVQKLQLLKPDLIISVHLRKVLKIATFSIAKKGAINIHPSLLPKYRGLSPQHQVLIHGENESAVTVHFIEEGIDTGDIIIQKKFEIKKDDYIKDVQFKMLSIYKSIMVEAVRLLENDNFKPLKQTEEGISYFGALKLKDREIDLSKGKNEIYNLIRAVSMPYKGAFSGKYTIWTSEFVNNEKENNWIKKLSDPGIYEDIENENIIIRLHDGILLSDDYELLN